MTKLDGKIQEDDSVTHRLVGSQANETQEDAQESHVYTITPQELTDKPISPMLCGHFVELGFGLQIEGLWSEMFFNRSFEKVQPYRAENDFWSGVRKKLTEPPLTDWTQKNWYHSNYEHNAWFAAPGEEGPFSVDPSATYFVNHSSLADVELRQVEDGIHGAHSLLVLNREKINWAGLGQQGKVLRRGVEYRFRGAFKNIRQADQARIQIYKEGEWDEPLHTIELSGIGREFSEQQVLFLNEEYEGRATFVLWIPPHSELQVDDFSLMPCDSIHGWRRDVVDMLKRVKTPIIRFPGGCFASFYDWRNAVGPYRFRTPEPSYHWGGMNYNDVGTAEFAMLSRELGSEIMLCINVFHPNKQKYKYFQMNSLHGHDLPQFTDHEAGIRLACDWVAYCNAPTTHPMGKLRAEHGYPEPFGITYWELDNEAFRWASAEEYASTCVAYGEAMKRIDPSIKLGMVTYGKPFEGKAEAMLEIAGGAIDFFADRGPLEGNVHNKIGLLRAYNEKHATDLRYTNTEWLCNMVHDPYTSARIEGIDRNVMLSSWGYALCAASNLMMWQRFGGDMLFSNFNNLANTFAQSVIETPKDKVVLTPVGHIFEVLSQSSASWPLAIVGYTPDQKRTLQVQAAWKEDRKGLVVYVLNRGPERKSVTFELSRLGLRLQSGRETILQAEDTLTVRTVKEPNEITRIDRPVALDGDQLRLEVPAFSFVEVCLD